MAILPFQKPDKVIMVEADETRGIFEFRPLEPGFGITIGNALRRILLSSLEGYAITSVKIEGVDQEFSTIKGVIEDVTEILLNIKQIRFKRQIESEISEKVNVVVGQQNVFKAGDINKFLSVFQVLNPDVVICHMEPNVKLNIELSIDRGRGYVPAEENKFHVENYRVEQKTDYEKLIIEMDTDGSIHPKTALKEAAKILIQHFMLFSDEKITLDIAEKAVAEEFDETSLHIRQLLKTKLVDMDLSVRALNCLKAADVETLGDLVAFNKNDLLKFRNFGKKSLTELEELVKSKGLEFGMNTAKYKLDKE
jgi:DNA-directed RNA polymerase subunit alpha